MRIDDIPKGVAGLPLEQKKPRTPEEAASQFEEVLLKQMLHSMTKEMFDSNLTGDDAPQWLGAYSEMQSDVLTTELAKQLSKSGRIGISEMLLKQWSNQGYLDEAAGARPDGIPTTDNSNE